MGLPCDNHPDRGSIVLVTMLELGSVLTLCSECFIDMCTAVFLSQNAGEPPAAMAVSPDNPPGSGDPPLAEGPTSPPNTTEGATDEDTNYQESAASGPVGPAIGYLDTELHTGTDSPAGL